MLTEEPEKVDELGEEGWVRVRRSDWREDAAYAVICPTFLRPVKAARLRAISKLRKGAGEAIERAKPQTPEAAEKCLRPALLEYAEHVFDERADAKLGASNSGYRSRAYGRWLRTKCLPAVVDDVCKPIFGQFHITAGHVGEMIGEGYSAEDAQISRALWGIRKEIIVRPLTEGLEKYLTIYLEGRSLHWEARISRLQSAEPAQFVEDKKPTGGPQEPNIAEPLKMESPSPNEKNVWTDKDSEIAAKLVAEKQSVSAKRAAQFLGCSVQHVRRLVHQNKLIASGTKPMQIKSESLQAYKWPTRDSKGSG